LDEGQQGIFTIFQPYDPSSEVDADLLAEIVVDQQWYTLGLNLLGKLIEGALGHPIAVVVRVGCAGNTA